jgi:flagellar hook-associated protein 2
MSGISSSVGIFSGIDTGALIEQLLQIEARPRTMAQQRIVQLQTQQTAFLDINTRLSALKNAATAFGTRNIFRSAQTTSSNDSILTATASAGAAIGSYTFLVDRLVSTQTMLSRGFIDRASSAIGASSFTFEPVQGRVDSQTPLSALNGGSGITRGTIQITDRSGASATIDLSRVATVDEVLAAINDAAGVRVTARVEGDHFVITDDTGATTTSLTVATSATATSLGIAGTAAGTTLTGSAVYRVVATTTLRSLNDGNGIRVNDTVGANTFDFNITDRAGVVHSIDIGNVYDADLVLTSAAPTTIQGVIDRINAATGGAVTASISADGSGITLTDNTGQSDSDLIVSDISGAGADLGILDTSGDPTLVGRRILAGINSTLALNLGGGEGIPDGAFSITARSGTVYNFFVPTGGSVSDIISYINGGSGTNGAVTASLDSTGTRLILTDNTGQTASNLIVTGGGATALGVVTEPAGVGAATVTGTRLQHAYVAPATTLASLNGGQGIGTGSFEITDSRGESATINVTASMVTVDDLVSHINSRGLNLTARINDNRDGILLEDNNATSGSLRIRVRDVSGTVAANLNLVGQAMGTGADNRLDGSYERTVTFAAGDTLDQVMQKINDARVGVSASIINDGSASNPFRLSLAATRTGSAGRFTIDTNGFDLGLTALAEGRDARVFYGSDDPATAVLLSSSTNTISNVVQGVTIDLHGTSTSPVTLTVSRDTEAIETALNEFVAAFNALTSRIDALTHYDSETQRRGTLLGDSTANSLRAAMFSTIQSAPQGVSGRYQSLAQIGVKFAGNGQLQLDVDRLREALQTDPQAVADLVAAKIQNSNEPEELRPGIFVNNIGAPTYSSLGVLEKIARLVESYLDPVSGILTRRKSTIDDQIRLQNDRIAAFNKKLENRRLILERQFSAMEQALGQLQAQQQSLAGLRQLVG